MADMNNNEKLMAQARERAEVVYQRIGNKVFDPNDYDDYKRIQGTTVNTMLKYGFIEKVNERIDRGAMNIQEVLDELNRWIEAYQEEFGYDDSEYFEIGDDGNIHRMNHITGYRFKEDFNN